MTNVPRNTAVVTQAYTQYDWDLWYGQVCPPTFKNNCTDSGAIDLSPGQYRLRFAALKHFGNASNLDDYEVYRTPLFNLVF